MKILLVYPSFLEPRVHAEDIGVPPIGLYYVAARLVEEGHEVHMVDAHGWGADKEACRRLFRDAGAKLIGFSVLHANRWGALDMAAWAKEVNPETKVVFGGPGATFLWEHLLAHFPQVDAVVLGEGEESFAELSRCLERKDSDGIERIRGIGFRKGGVPVKTLPRDPIPDLDGLPDPARFFTFRHVVSSRGCPRNCAFCGSPRIWGRRVRFHSPRYFVDQLERLHQKGVRFFFVSDDTFTLKKDRVVEICREVLRRGLEITWAAISHVDHVDEEMLSWMRKAGCIQISYGVESGSEEIRKRLGKNLQRDRILRAFRLTSRYGMMARAYFIYGSPGETWESIGETVELMEEIRPLGAVFYILDLFPGTQLYEEWKQREKATDDLWLEKIEDVLYWETDPALSKEDVLAFGRRLRGEFYRRLPEYALNVELVDRKDLYAAHADFLSRLGLTFTHGEYAQVKEIPDKAETAERLYERALRYHPDERAYLGLGMLRQRQRRFEESVGVLQEGIGRAGGSDALNHCLGVSLMNLGRYKEALEALERVENRERTREQRIFCREKLGGSP